MALTQRLAAIAMIALATAGCIGSTSSSTSTGRSDDLGLIPLRTDLTIIYFAPTCPPGARCAYVPDASKYYLVRRHLTCSPDGGDYDNPAAVCRALADVVTKYDADPTALAICACPAMRLPLAKAVGFYRGKRRTIHLDGCSLCGLRGIGPNIALLMPQA